MKVIALISLIVVVSSMNLEGLHVCTAEEKVPGPCTREYNPTCGYLDDRVNCASVRKPCAINAGNPCSACKTRDVVGYTVGNCPTENLITRPPQAVREIACPENRPQMCTREYRPVCAWLDTTRIQCDKAPCAFVASNKCVACSDANVRGFSEGECPAN